MRAGAPLCGDLGEDLGGALVVHEPLDCMVLEEDPGLLGLRLPEAVDPANGLEHTVVVLAPLQQHDAAAVGVHVQPQRTTVEGGQEDRGGTLQVRELLDRCATVVLRAFFHKHRIPLAYNSHVYPPI